MYPGGSPLVTIVTPTLNQAPYIRATLRSVAEQDYPHIEHIVIDGGSTDGTLDILREWGGHWISEPDAGQADAINKGVKMAKGDLFGWLNSDDVYLVPDAISSVVNCFLDGAMIVSGRGAYLDAQGAHLEDIVLRPELLSHANLRFLDSVLQPATFYTTDLARRYPLDVSLHWTFDWDLFVRMTDEAAIVPLDRAIAGYRLHGTGKSITGGQRRQRELMRVTARYSGVRSLPFVLLATAFYFRTIGLVLPGGLAKRLDWRLGWIGDRISWWLGGPGMPH